MTQIHLIPILKDNYVFLIEGHNNECLVIDPGDTAPILQELQKRNLTLTHILNTHHHWDHTDGNIEIKKATNCTIVGPEQERTHIPGLDKGLIEGDTFSWQNLSFEIIHTPGHTAGHITYYEPQLKAAFVGDVIFSMGCGRLFEGTSADAYGAFQKILSLPDETMIYCAHEYTLANAKFAMEVETDNQALQMRHEEVKELRRKKQPTIPVSLKTEKETNPFLRCQTMESFAKLRHFRDHY